MTLPSSPSAAPPGSRPRRGRGARRGALALTCTLSLVSTMGAVALGTSHADAAPVDSGPASRAQAFAAAAHEFGVPSSVLQAVSYSESRWEAHAGEHNTDGGYGPMNLIDGTLFAPDAAEAKDGTLVSGAGAIPATVDSLGRAATLLGVDRDVLRKDATANIRGGAALLAVEQKALGLPLGATSDPGQWYATVAHASGSAQAADAQEFADNAYAVIAAGAARTTTDGKAVAMPATAVTPQKSQLARLGLAVAKANPNLECPQGLGCEWIPAPYEELDGGGYGNHDLAQRDVGSPAIDYIVIHDTEASYATTLALVQDPTYVSWHYTVRSADGHIAQHVPTKDVAWHAGNWYVNTHSIGIEHEGFAPQGATWFTEAMYRKSAKLVGYLTTKYNIPVDRAHIIGHDQVPGIDPAHVAGMHWDPGPYWDWEHYFALLGHPLSSISGKPSNDVVRILPGFARNKQPVTGCDTAGVACAAQGTNFVYLRTSPSAAAPLVSDIGLYPDGRASTTDVADVGARATAGMEFAVAGRQGDWTAIWYLGSIAWFKNPVLKPTAIPVPGSYVVPKKGLTSVATFGVAYPQASEFPAGLTPQVITPLPYTVKAGQRVVLADSTVATDYYYA
ncbi:MAG: peptidoglycan recognition family protein, partial [Lapillicoccus sp.]